MVDALSLRLWIPACLSRGVFSRTHHLRTAKPNRIVSKIYGSCYIAMPTAAALRFGSLVGKGGCRYCQVMDDCPADHVRGAHCWVSGLTLAKERRLPTVVLSVFNSVLAPPKYRMTNSNKIPHCARGLAAAMARMEPTYREMCLR